MIARHRGERPFPRLFFLFGALVGLVEAAAIDRVHPVIEEPWRRAIFYIVAILVDAIACMIPIALLALVSRRAPLMARGLSVLVVLGALLLLGSPILTPEGGAAGEPGATRSDRTSLLLVTVDTLRADHVSAYGHAPVKTPAMDAVAADGALFLEAYCQAPLTGPSHATLLSGLLPPAHGSRYNAVPALMPASALAPTLKAAGYRTAAFVSASVLTDAMSGLALGFDTYDQEFLPDAGSQQIYRLALARTLLHVLHLEKPERRARVTVERALAWIERARNAPEPLFLWVHVYDPHIPYAPPRRFREEADPGYAGSFTVDRDSVVDLREGRIHPTARDLEHGRRLYAAEVAYADACLAPLLSAVRAMPGPFLVVVCADHGESLGEHHYFYYHGENLLSPSMHVPLLLAGPGVPRGARVQRLVRLSDVMPTCLDLLELPIPSGIDGRTLRPLLSGNVLPELPSYGEDGDLLHLAPVTGRLPLASKDVGLRTSRYNYVLRPAKSVERLYDLASDPGEEHDLSQEPATTPLRAAMKARLQRITDLSSYAGADVAAPDEEARRALHQLGYVEGRGSP